MNRSRLLSTLCACLLAISSLPINAALIDRGSGLIYDTDMDITWISDAGIGGLPGQQVNHSQAVSWAENLVYAGFDNWRLPSILGDECKGFNCTTSEFGHLFYIELGGEAVQSITDSADPDLALFSDFRPGYWAAESAPAFESWNFTFLNIGNQNHAGRQWTTISGANFFYAWAVHDGDIGAVPLPAAAWLFGSGLLGLIGIAKRKAG